ncbi:hypothetical protein [Streptomyces sp. NPDC048496]|uniref:hypothetical protein n=1 Tax=Streptomyces sp. NPDC048496 TaxID=3365558 RepID=UPI0037226801
MPVTFRAPVADLTVHHEPGTAIRTTVGATKDVPTVNTIDRNGNPATGDLSVFDRGPARLPLSTKTSTA